MDIVAPPETNKPPYTLQVACLEPNGETCRLSEQEVVTAFRDEKRVPWIHVTFNDVQATAKFLDDHLGFHELAVEDALTDHARPTLHEYEDHLFLAVSKIEIGDRRERFIEIGIFLKEDSLVTVSPEPVDLINSWFDRWIKRPTRFGTHPAYVMHSIIDSVVDEYFSVVDALEDRGDEIADGIYRGESTRLKDIQRLKRRFLEIRRHVAPTRDMMNGLLRRDITMIPDETRPYFQDIYDHTIRIVEVIEINREALTSLLDIHLSTVSNNLNQVLKKMTVISTMLMTAALVAGIYGMNFVHMPELRWVNGYPFALGMMVLSMLIVLGFFRWRKWI